MISSTDHLPVVINLDIKIKKDKSKFKHKVTKRSFKNFTTEAWNESLERKDWSPIYSSNTVDEMVDVFQKNIEEALNDIAPVKTFTIRSNYKFGLSDETKKVMHERDVTRGKIRNVNKCILKSN